MQGDGFPIPCKRNFLKIFFEITKKKIDQFAFLGYTQKVWIMIIHNYVLLRSIMTVEHRNS